MSYGTIQDAPPAAGRAKVRFVPDLPAAAPSSSPDEDSNFEIQERTLLERVKFRLNHFYERNFGLFLVFLSQTCGSVVSFLFSSPADLAMVWLIVHGLDEYSSKAAHQ